MQAPVGRRDRAAARGRAAPAAGHSRARAAPGGRRAGRATGATAPTRRSATRARRAPPARLLAIARTTLRHAYPSSYRRLPGTAQGRVVQAVDGQRVAAVHLDSPGEPREAAERRGG